MPQPNGNTATNTITTTDAPTTSKPVRRSRASSSKLPDYVYDVNSDEDDQIDYSPGEDEKLLSDDESTTEFKSPRG